MGTGADVKPSECEAADHPMVLFFALLHGRRTGDFQMAERAKQRLAEKGVRVTFTRRRARPGADKGARP
jgi:hypothetical protein